MLPVLGIGPAPAALRRISHCTPPMFSAAASKPDRQAADPQINFRRSAEAPRLFEAMGPTHPDDEGRLNEETGTVMKL